MFEEILGATWAQLLASLDDAVLVLDEQRTLRYANQGARRLLGYDDGEPIGGRCRLTTHGVDCENACPLTFALEGDLEGVQDFATVYHTREGTPVPLKVTIIPVRGPDGDFRGAVEILRSTEPDVGFVLAGRGDVVSELRRRIDRLAAAHSHVALIGEEPACADVALALHRLSGMADALFFRTVDGWTSIPTWPPGTLYAAGEGMGSVLAQPPREGWRLVVSASNPERLRRDAVVPFETVEVPRASDLGGDLPLVLAAWLAKLAPGLSVSSGALQQLCRMASDLGFERLQHVLTAAVAVAGDRLEAGDISCADYHTVLVDELLRRPDPLAAMEERLLREVLERSGWRMQDAAERLGISRVTLWRKLKDHGIERPDSGDASARQQARNDEAEDAAVDAAVDVVER